LSQRVRIVQLLCPARHCILAIAYESLDGNAIPYVTDHLFTAFTRALQVGMNPWCGICDSRDLTYEDQPTRFATILEAQPHLAEAARRNAATREYFRASKG